MFLFYFLSEMFEAKNTFEVVEAKEGYYIFKTGLNEFYVRNNSGYNFTIGEYIKLAGGFEKLDKESNYFQFNFYHFLNEKNIMYELKIEKVYSIDSSSIRTKFYNWISNKSELIQLIVGQRHSGRVYDRLVELSLSFMINASSVNLYLLTLLFKRNKKINYYFHFVWILPTLFYLYILNFPIILFKTFLLLFFKVSEKKFRIHLTKPMKFGLVWSIELIMNPFYIFNIGFIYITIAFIFIKFINDYSKIKNLIINLLYMTIIFLPVQQYYDYKIFWTSEILQMLLLPICSLVYALAFLLLPFANYDGLFNLLEMLLYHYVQIVSFVNVETLTGHINSFLGILYYITLYFIVTKSRYINIKFTQKAFLSCFSAFLFSFWSSVNIFSNNNSINMINVGNGNSFHLKLNNKNYLFDAGSGFFENKDILKDYLEYYGINHISTVFISHNHLDHYDQLNNLDDVSIDNYIYWNNVRKTYYVDGIEISNFQKINHSDENDNSQVLFFNFKNNKILFTGDISKNREYELLNDSKFVQLVQGGVDFMQIAHHGSSTSSSGAFISTVKPKNCFISGKYEKGRPFPAKETLNTLKENKCKTFVTNGTKNYRFMLNSHKTKQLK